jgi:hypothetical protein
MKRKIVSVQFYRKEGYDRLGEYAGKQYHYFVPEEWEVKKGDFLIVNPRYDEFCIVKVAKHEGFTREQRKQANKWAVATLDRTEYDRRCEAEIVVREIKAELADAKEDYEEMMIYETLAKTNKNIKNLLERLNAVESGKLLTEVTTPAPKEGDKDGS